MNHHRRGIEVIMLSDLGRGRGFLQTVAFPRGPGTQLAFSDATNTHTFMYEQRVLCLRLCRRGASSDRAASWKAQGLTGWPFVGGQANGARGVGGKTRRAGGAKLRSPAGFCNFAEC